MQPKPRIGRADCLFQLHDRFRCDPAAAGNQIVKLLPRDAKATRGLGGGTKTLTPRLLQGQALQPIFAHPFLSTCIRPNTFVAIAGASSRAIVCSEDG
jgi:hypothetical protein